MHEAYLILGSNIDPVENIDRAFDMLGEAVEIVTLSSVWRTKAFESKGPDFLNRAARIRTNLMPDELKWDVLRKIEAELGRVRTEDKNAPRTIDLDIIIFDGRVLDEKLWERYYVAIPIAELLPNFEDPRSKRPLHEVAEELKQESQSVQIEKI